MSNEEQEKINQACFDILEKVYENNENIICFSNDKSNKLMIYDGVLSYGSLLALEIVEMMEKDKSLKAYNHVTLTEWWEVSSEDIETLRKYHDTDTFIEIIEFNGKHYARDSHADEENYVYDVNIVNINGEDKYVIVENRYNGTHGDETSTYTYSVSDIV